MKSSDPAPRRLKPPARLLEAMGILLLPRLASAALEVIENPGSLRVANGRIAVTLTQQQGAADILVAAADTAGTWHPVCRTLRPDFVTTPAANKLFDTSDTPHRYQANQIFTEFSIASRSDQQVKIRLSGQINNQSPHCSSGPAPRQQKTI